MDPRSPADSSRVERALRRLTTNLLWSFDPALRRALRDLDPEGWDAHAGNAQRWFAALPPSRLAAWAGDPDVCARVAAASEVLDRHLGAEDSWWSSRGASLPGPVAYFCAEFGVHEHLPIYAGGLGVLAGDHCKSASDLGIPLVAVGLFYREGYFVQSVDPRGWQVEVFDANRPEQLPVTPVLGDDGAPLRVPVPLWGRTVRVGVLRADVGRVPVFLLDADVEGNGAEDRGLTRQLYGGDLGMRLGQEVLLGIGGMRALRAMGIEPAVTHMNEGHSALLGLEWMRRERARGADLATARARARSRSVFTTHTPVPAGHDCFGLDLVEHALASVRSEIGLSLHELMGLGRVRPDDAGEPFCMTVLALKLSAAANGVSMKHGEVSRRMWTSLWPGASADDVPIGHVTNGVHAATWVGDEVQAVLDRQVGLRWRGSLAEGKPPLDLAAVPDAELWRAHQAHKSRLVELVRGRVAEHRRRLGAAQADVDAASSILSEQALLVGFARRFATYKRADLLFQDYERALRLLTRADRPVHLLFAGKAHPKDEPGKELMARVVAASRDPRLAGRVVFLENYDLGLGRALVQGVDLWLNTPRRPKEASGTSGQKAAINGVLNLSVLDGWWFEGFQPGTGWAIGGTDVADDDQMDRQDRESLYRVLEQEVVPRFFDRDADGLPRDWISRMRASIADALPRFNSDRMVAQYVEQLYEPVARRAAQGGGRAEDAA